MDIDTPLRELGEVDCTALRDAILAQPEEAWFEDQYRQETYDVHYDTQSMVLVFVDLDRWPDIVEVHTVLAAATFLGLLPTGVLHEYPPHRLSGSRKEVPASIPLLTLLRTH